MVVNFSIVPIGKETSLSTQVAEVLTIVSESGISYRLHAMGTILEGTWASVLEVVKKMHESVFDDQIQRVVTTIRIDDRRDRESSVERKIQSVTEKLK